MNRRSQIKRVGLLCTLMVLICGLMVLRLVDLQVVNGAAYREEAERKILRTYKQPASRGEYWIVMAARWFPTPWAFPSLLTTILGIGKPRTM